MASVWSNISAHGLELALFLAAILSFHLDGIKIKYGAVPE